LGGIQDEGEGNLASNLRSNNDLESLHDCIFIPPMFDLSHFSHSDLPQRGRRRSMVLEIQSVSGQLLELAAEI